MDLPKDTNELYWHCRAMHKGRNNRYEDYDLTFSDLCNFIVSPYILYQELIIGGQRFKSRDDIEQILIKWTPKSQKSYPTKNEPGYGGMFLHISSEDHCFDSGKDFTAAILTMVQKEEGTLKSSRGSLVNIYNANENTNTNVNSLQIHSDAMTHIDELRDKFDEFRSHFCNATTAEASSMKEVQDKLDEINRNSTNQEVNGVLTKLNRFLKKTSDSALGMGERILISASAMTLLEQVKALYEIIKDKIG